MKTASSEGRIYQIAMLVLLSLIPAVALIHFWRVFASGPVVTLERVPRRVQIWDWTGLHRLDDPARICTELAPGPELKCVDGVTFFPGIQPAILAVLTGMSVVAVLVHWWTVFLRKSPCLEVEAAG
jgi:hypothetical protein